MFENTIKTITNKLLNDEPISFDLIKYYGSPIFENELIALADNIVFSSLTSSCFGAVLSNVEKAQVIVAVTYITLCYYDSNTWKYIREKFKKTFIDGKSNQRAENKIRDILGTFKEKTKFSGNNAYVAVPNILAGVTHHWLDSFFDFCFNIYKLNMLARKDIGSEELISEELENTFSSIRSHLDENNDEIKIGTNQSYQLSRFTQSALKKGVFVDEIIAIGTYCIIKIISYLKEENVEVMDFFNDAFNKWKSGFNLNKSEKEAINSIDTGSWKIDLKYINGKIWLYTKTEKIAETVELDSVHIDILENGAVVDTIYDLQFSEAVGGYLVAKKGIMLNCNILNNISYRVIAGDSVVYDCKDKLYKGADILFFDEKGEQIRAFNDYYGALLVATKTSVSYGSFVCRGNGYQIHQIIVNQRESYEFDGKKYDFKTTRNPGIEGEKCDFAHIYRNLDRFECDLYYSISSILIETRSDKEKLKLFVDGKEYANPSLIDYGMTENDVSQIRFEFLIDDEGYHEVYVYDGENEKKVSKSSFAFVVDSNFKKRIVKKDKNSYELFVNSRFVNDSIVLRCGCLEHRFKCAVPGLGPCCLVVDPEIIAIDLGNNVWLEDGDRLSAKNFTIGAPFIYFTGPKDVSFRAVNNKGYLLPNLHSDYMDGRHRLNIGPLLDSNAIKTPFVCLLVGNNQAHTKFYLDYTLHINMANSYFYYSQPNNRFEFSYSYSENKAIKMTIQNALNSQNIVSFSIEPNKKYAQKINNIRPFIPYHIILIETNDDFFGQSEKEIERVPYLYVDPNQFENHEFEIKKTDLFSSNDKELICSVNSDTYYLSFVKRIGNNYLCALFGKDDYGNKHLVCGKLLVYIDGDSQNKGMWVEINEESYQKIGFFANKKQIRKYSKELIERLRLIKIIRLYIEYIL